MLSRTCAAVAMRAPARGISAALLNGSSVQTVSSESRQKHSLPDLPYDYNALEPVVSAEIMQLHHRLGERF